MTRLLWWRTACGGGGNDDSDGDGGGDLYDDDDEYYAETPTMLTSSGHAMTPNKNLMPHDQFLQRIRKTLYVGGHISVSAPSANSQKISRPLADYAAELFSAPHRGHSLNRLHAVTVSKLQATPCSLILAMVYMDRLRASDPLYATKITPTELFLVSMLVSSKFYYGYDESVHIDDFLHAADDQLSLAALKALELDLLDALNWDVYVSNAEFFAKLCTVERQLAERQGCARGWLTYTELTQLFPSLAIARAFLKYSTVFAISYAASVFTIAGAFLVASQVPGTALYRPTQTQTTTATATTTTSTTNSNTTDLTAAGTTDALLRLDANEPSADADAELLLDATAETEHDRAFDRLAAGFADEATSNDRTNSSLPDPHDNAFMSTPNWTLNAQLDRLHNVLERMRDLLLDSGWSPKKARPYGNDNGDNGENRTTGFDWWQQHSGGSDSALAPVAATSCRRASGYETLLRWMEVM